MSTTAASGAPRWQKIIQMGEQLLEAKSLVAQRDLIIETVTDLVDGNVTLWLDEHIARTPGHKQAETFLPLPPTEASRSAAQQSKTIRKKEGTGSTVAMPLINQNTLLGVLQVDRPAGPAFREAEIDLLEGLASHASLTLMVAHRLSVESWRIEQLTLVRKVSAQIANVLNLDQLSSRVTDLIRRTFRYYYVAIFTLESGQKKLRFRSSASSSRQQEKEIERAELDVEVGQGLIGQVAESGIEIVSNNTSSEPQFRYVESLPHTRSEVVLPLKIESKVLGVLDVQSRELNAFHPNDLLVLRALADNIALAVEGTHLYSDLDQRARNLEMVAHVSQDITSILDLEQLLARVAELIHDRLGCPYVHLYTVHPNRRQIIYEAGSGARSALMAGFILNLDSPEGLIPFAAQKMELVLANDVSRETRYSPSPVPPADTRAEMVVPLIYNNEVVGILDLQTDRLNAFSSDDRVLMEALGGTIASAIRNASLYRSEQWRRQVADSLREVAGLLSANHSVDDVLDTVLRELERNLPCEVSAIWLEEGGKLYLAHIHGADPGEVEATLSRWPETYSFLFNTMTEAIPVIRKPMDPLGPSGAALGYAADYSSIAASLRIGDRPLGVLTLSHHSPGRYGHEAQGMTATFSSYAAVAIENARLFDSAQEQAYASAALLQVAQTIADADSLDEIIASIARMTPILVGVKSCAIYLHDQGVFHPSQAYNLPEEVETAIWGRDFPPGEFLLLDTVFERGKTAIGLLGSNSPEDWMDPALAMTEQDTIYALEVGEHLLIGIPLMVKNDIYGVMLVEEVEESRRFRNKRIEIITSIAQQVALSIENEHLQQEQVIRERLEHEIQLARQIQQTFIPEHLPQFSGWELAASWRTARQVGGDFYDVFKLKNEHLGLLIADVSDKGIPAALFMALTRTLIRAVVFDTPSPADALARVNDLILPDNRQGMFVTAFYGVLDLVSGSLQYANAGHNPPLWLDRNGGMKGSLKRTAMALGVVEEYKVDENVIHIEPGDGLLMYTDGLVDAFSKEGAPFGEEGVKKVIEKAGAIAMKELLRSLESAVDDFTSSMPLGDDLTMLALQRGN